jgi:phosphoserine phosphatase
MSVSRCCSSAVARGTFDSRRSAQQQQQQQQRQKGGSRGSRGGSFLLRRGRESRSHRCATAKATAGGESMSSSSSKKARAMEIWRACDAVCFDVDSTVIDHEGIDALAAYLGKGEEVAKVTTQAMNGEIPFEKALFYRLNAMQCSRQQMDAYLKEYPVKLSNGFQELRDKLKEKGKTVYLVSGGFRQMIHPIAEYLDIPVPTNVWANNLLYLEDGSMNSEKPFDDENEFTWRAGGKALAVAHVKKTGNFKTVVMVGDGATDVEARAEGGADIVIGYGGTVRRESVEKSADWFVMDFKELVEAL